MSDVDMFVVLTEYCAELGACGTWSLLWLSPTVSGRSRTILAAGLAGCALEGECCVLACVLAAVVACCARLCCVVDRSGTGYSQIGKCAGAQRIDWILQGQWLLLGRWSQAASSHLWQLRSHMVSYNDLNERRSVRTFNASASQKVRF